MRDALLHGATVSTLLFIVLSVPFCVADDLRSSGSVIDVPRVKTPIKFEDFLNTRRLEKLKKIGSFVQTGQNEGLPAVHPTEAYLAHDDTRLIVFFVCSSPAHAEIVGDSANIKRQTSREWVEVVIDFFEEPRRSYLFRASPEGFREQVQFLQGVYAGDLNQPWFSESQSTDHGYAVELSIPYSSLDANFANPALHRIWGIRLRRWINETQQYIHWPGPNEEDGRARGR
jgi:hypothetical protein